MPPAPLPPTEVERLAALHSYKLLDTASEEAFDELVTLAARLTGSPIAAVTLVDADRQWFKALHGLEVTETPREHAFCAYTILEPGSLFVVENATADPRFQDNPLVIGAPAIRAYLGVSLVNPEGHALGALCVIDRVTRSFEAETIETMRTLARAVTANLELRRMLFRTREAALTDQLTGLPNRRAILEVLEEATANSEPVAVIAVDLDHFKEANDSEGHAAGDALLRVAAGRLRDLVRPGDVVGRVGGDEFVVLLVGKITSDAVIAIAQRVSAALHRPVPHDDRLLRLGATLGVAIMPDDVAEPELGLRVADEALVRAKQEKRGSIGRATPEDATQLLRAAFIIRAFDLDAAAVVALPGAVVHLQPIVALQHVSDAAPRIVAFEALARWSHPDVGTVPPSDLFDAIGPERSAQLGYAVREQALVAFAALRQAGLPDARIALNLSSNEVCRADIALHIAKQVERVGLSLRHVEIEITEEILLDRVSNRTLDQLTFLRGQGARLVLDDFGTGNSGLAQLLRLPIDGVKLDKQFIQRLGLDTRAEAIVRATVSLAHSLGLKVVAEGIETEQQDTMVKALGCNAGQGFLYARPMPPDLLRVWLDARASHDDPGVAVLRPKAAGDAYRC